MNYSQENRISEWITDTDPKYLLPSQAFYIKNREFFDKLGKSTAMGANYAACNITFPAGENYAIKAYSCERTNEVYVYVFNTNGVNFIYRVGGNGCDIVYDEDCLPFTAEPKNEITQWRSWLDVKKTCKNWAGKRLIWTDGNFQGCLDVEASIATNGFTTPFFQYCSDPCDFVALCVPKPNSSIKATYLPKSIADRLLANKLVDVGFQFMYRWVYYDGRKSSWSDISSFYYQSSRECFSNDDGFSRCMNLRIPVGNAMVTIIEIAFRNNNGTQWYLAERFEKYDNYVTSQQQWYERDFSATIKSQWAVGTVIVPPPDCSIDYKFCNDKLCEPLTQEDTNKAYNPFPRGAQCLFPFKESLAFVNYLKGNCPLPKSISDNLKIAYDCTGGLTCKKSYVTVKVRAIIHEYSHNRNQFVFVEGTDPVNDTARFGGVLGAALNQFILAGHRQQFYDKTRNFIAYIEGTEYYAEMKQWRHDPNGTETEVGVLTGLNSLLFRQAYSDFINNGGYYYQEAIFTVPKGTRGLIRLGSHNNTFNDTSTSTFVKQIANLLNYNGRANLGDVDTAIEVDDKEIFFDACNGDVDIKDKAFVIRDNIIQGSNVDPLFLGGTTAVSGYVKDKSGNPIEGAVVDWGGRESRTDHNGFYHIIGQSVDGAQNVTVLVEQDPACGNFTVVKNDTVTFVSRSMVIHDFVIDDVNYLTTYKSKVTVIVEDCNGITLPGVRVALSGTKYQVSNNSGEANFYIRQYNGRNRVLTAIVMDKNGCFETDCSNQCNPCLPLLTGFANNCFDTTPQQNLGIVQINISNLINSDAHLKYGGEYSFGGVAEGDCGNLSFVNMASPNINIPKQCSTINTPCILTYDLSGMVFPLWVKNFKLVRTRNLNPFELQWVVDKVDYVGNKIKLTIQSLNDYNFNNFFKTNTIYQYLKGDRIEFISDENGEFYCNSLNYQILSPYHDQVISGKKDAPADFFNQLLIEDDGRILSASGQSKVVKPGTIIEMQRPAECEVREAYYTIGVDFDVVPNAAGTGGIIVNPIGTFTTFDTYNVRRTIGTNTAREFEHHAPSDFWGDKLQDIGTPHIVNEFEDEKRYDRNITICDADDFNSFGTLVKTIGDASMGGIVAANITDDKILLFIHENDNTISQTAEGLLTVGNDGAVQAISGDQILSNPSPKLAGKYGCQYDHIGSIYFGDGYATWADVNRHALIVHDYQIAKEASFNKIGNWTRRRFEDLAVWNNLSTTNAIDKYRFSTGFNKRNGMVMLTLKQLRQSGIDNELEPNISLNETICYHPLNDKFYGQPSFTPEAYASINLFNGQGAAFITINKAETWVHPMIPTAWGEYYGVPIDQVVTIAAVNQFPKKIKRGLAMEVQGGGTMWFVSKVQTDNPNFISEVPPSKWKKNEDKYNAGFLFNINARGGLHGNQNNYAGESTRGYYILVTFVRDNTNGLIYGSIDNNKRRQSDNLDAIITKYFMSDQSGMDENV